MFFKKEYQVSGRRFVGIDPFGKGPVYANDYKEVVVPIWNRIVMAIIAMVIVIGGIIGAIMVMGSEDATIENIPTTTLVDEPSTDMVETQVAMVEETTTTAPVVVDKYVCNTETMSTEYHFQDDEYVWADGIQREIPWTSLLSKDIVMLWSINDDTKYTDFVSDITLFNEYTHAGVRVEKYGYLAQADDFIVPVISENIEGDFAWADMGVGVGVSSLFGMETVAIKNAALRFDQLGLDNWEYHTHTVLHEMGHLFGLSHTHDGEGQQTDSIMSYESDYEVAGYLPGDIAGLKEVFCN